MRKELLDKMRLQSYDSPPSPPCDTLRKVRQEAGLTKAQVAALCMLADLPDGDFDQVVRAISSTLRSLEPSGSEGDAPKERRRGERGGKFRVPDTSHLSRIENGYREPWDSLRKDLCRVFSVFLGKHLTEQDLFPELFEGELEDEDGALAAQGELPSTHAE